MIGLNPDELNIGAYGGVHLGAGDETPTGKFGCIMPYSDTVFTTVNQETEAAITGDSMAGVTWPAGIPIFGNFNYVKLTSGRCIAYRYRTQ